MTGNNVDSNTQRRIAGVQKAVGETGGKVTVLTRSPTWTRPADRAEAVSDLLSAHGKEINGIVTTAYNPAVAAAGCEELRAADQGGRHRRRPQISRASRRLGLRTIAQNPPARPTSALGAVAAGVGRVHGEAAGAVVDSGSFAVTKANVDTYDTERKTKTDQLKSQFSGSVLQCS